MDMNVLFPLMMVTLTMASPPGRFDGMVGDTHGWYGVDNDIVEDRDRVRKGCGGKAADVYFIFDTAIDVNSILLDQQKEYASNLAKVFYYGQGTSRIGAISYGESVQLAEPLTGNPSLFSIFKSIPQVGGYRSYVQVLDFLRRKAFASNVARKSVGHVAILFTSGSSVHPDVSALQARLAQESGIYLYVVGFGKNTDKGEMTTIASKPASQFLFMSHDYSIADALVELLGIHICDIQIYPPVQGIEKGCIAFRPVDLIISMDQASIGVQNTGRILNFVATLTDEMDNSDSKININIVAGRNINFGDLSKEFENVDDFTSKMNSITIPDYSDVLRRARRQFSRGRFGVQKTLLIFVDENVEINKRSLIEAKRNKFSKIDTYVVAIGEHLDDISLNILASGPDDQHLIRVSNYDELLELKNWTLKRLCRGW